MRAYVLIQAHPDQTKYVFAALEAIRGLEELHEVTGPYDIVAKVKVTNLSDLSKSMRAIPGVLRTTILVAFPE
jgi:DNA-binding Lrp family transcriptional regulator